MFSWTVILLSVVTAFAIEGQTTHNLRGRVIARTADILAAEGYLKGQEIAEFKASSAARAHIPISNVEAGVRENARFNVNDHAKRALSRDDYIRRARSRRDGDRDEVDEDIDENAYVERAAAAKASFLKKKLSKA